MLVFIGVALLFASCQRNKVTCPTYQYSFPDSQKPKKQSIKKLSPNKFKQTKKAKSSVMPK